MSNPLDLEELEKLAKAATPGPWVYHFATGEFPSAFWIEVVNGKKIPRTIPDRASDSEFIAAANPSTVLAIIAQLRIATEALEVAYDCLTGFRCTPEQALADIERILGVKP